MVTRTTMATIEVAAFDPVDWIVQQETAKPGLPWVTLSYAQSLDGSIAHESGNPTQLSSPEAMQLTHRLRAVHDGILVGVGTVLADNPQLTVRLAPGQNPRPVVLDSCLRTPPTARLLQNNLQPAVIFRAEDADPLRINILTQCGALLKAVPCGEDGGLDLATILNQLYAFGIRRLMVEGGAKVIRSFVSGGWVDGVVITIAPRWLGGMPALREENNDGVLPQIDSPTYQVFGSDVVVIGRVTH